MNKLNIEILVELVDRRVGYNLHTAPTDTIRDTNYYRKKKDLSNYSSSINSYQCNLIHQNTYNAMYNMVNREVFDQINRLYE